MSAKAAYSRLPMIVAHRGASRDAPENTIRAFKLAWNQDADAIEGDFRMTADGIIACFHDPQARFKNGATRNISEVAFRDLRNIEYNTPSGSSGRITVPTLTDVLGIVKEGKRLFIEVKCGREILPGMLSQIRDSRIRPDQVSIISFHQEVITALKEMAPDIKANWLVKFRRDRLRLCPNSGTIIKTIRQIGADGVGVQASRKLTRRFVSAIKDAGFEFHVWTVDSPAMARKFVQLGVDSITTNKPQAIRSCLVKFLPAD